MNKMFEKMHIDDQQILNNTMDNMDNMHIDDASNAVNISNQKNMDVLQYEIFHKNLDIYDPENLYIMLGVPNVQCKCYFDDEDFIYTKLGLSDSDTIDFNVINYITTHNIIIDFSNTSLDSRQLYAKILYIYQYSSMYYGSLSGLRPRDRMLSMPGKLLQWLDNIVNILRVMLDNNLFNSDSSSPSSGYQPNQFMMSLDHSIKQILGMESEPVLNKQLHIDNMNIIVNDNYDNNSGNIQYTTDDFTSDVQYSNELITGLNLVICHIKMLLNHYKIKRIPLVEMEDKHIKKLFKLINNMCIIIIHLRHILPL